MNATTARVITEDDRFSIQDRSPIGSRYTDGDEEFTLVAYSVDPHGQTAFPLFIADADIAAGPNTHWYDQAAKGSIALLEVSDVVGIGSEVLHPASPDQERTDAALAALASREEHAFRDTSDFSRVMLHGDLSTEEEVAAFLAYAKAELELRVAQRQLEMASRERSELIARVADLTGSQRRAARVLGLNQSTISRALRERPERP
ncbi:LysR family transcriptional regulator [Streptomyces rochei]|uniref:helix-turn-helix domain-containing protein n=1 Tax=Streptomyces TaxID=1883 RepID=UPI000FA5A86E|nr:LysR family transcriptional regulator [Streptomyces sp. WAC08401]RSS11428.1 LysR family transcriptional regulator [Streptomyces sp. WAC08401]